MNIEELQARYDALCAKADEGRASEEENEQRVAFCHALDSDMQDATQEWTQMHPEWFHTTAEAK